MQSNSNSEYTDVQKVIELYLQGHAQNSPTHMRQAFLPTARVEGNRDGSFTSWSLDQYCGLFTNTPAVDEQCRCRTIDWIEISGDTASARATLAHGEFVFVDYFILLRVAGEWKIANKVYYRANSSLK